MLMRPPPPGGLIGSSWLLGEGHFLQWCGCGKMSMLLQAILMELAGLRGGERESRGGLAGERKGISGEGTEGGKGVSMFKITLHMYESAMLTPIYVYNTARPKKLQVGLPLKKAWLHGPKTSGFFLS